MTIDQFQHIEIQPNLDEALGNNYKVVGFLPHSFALWSIALGWILIYQNWPIAWLRKYIVRLIIITQFFSRFSLNLYSLYLLLNLSETQYSLYCKDAIVSPLSVLPAFCTCVHVCVKELQVKWISRIIADFMYVACTKNMQKYYGHARPFGCLAWECIALHNVPRRYMQNKHYNWL